MNLSSLVPDLASEYDGNREHYDRDDLVRLLIDLRELSAGVRAFTADVQADLLAHADERSWVVDGIGEVRVRKQTKRSAWDNDGLTRKLVALALDERVLIEETGEYESPWEAVARVLSECSRPSWRVTPLRARGIDETEFCTVTPDGWSVELPPRAT